jgi:nucleosome binding factor SPN SPT16 subunit
MRFKEVQKTMRAREQTASAKKGLVEQAKLQLLSRDMNPPCLRDILMRPVMSNRKQSGRIEAHKTGLRFLASRTETFDLLYANILHGIFEPCVNSMSTVLHFFLKNEVIVNNKRTKNVQYFVEVMNATEDLTGTRGGELIVNYNTNYKWRSIVTTNLTMSDINRVRRSFICTFKI